MSLLQIDHDKLSNGLKLGLGNTKTYVARVPAEKRLRLPVCGITSKAIQLHLNQLGVPNSLMYNNSLNNYHDTAHIYVLAEVEEPVIIDAAYSQFLGFVGLTHGYDWLVKKNEYPVEEILDFKVSETVEAANWLAQVATQFKSRNEYPRDQFGRVFGMRTLANASFTELQSVYRGIWDAEHSTVWQQSDHLLEKATIVADFIKPGSISLIS